MNQPARHPLPIVWRSILPAALVLTFSAVTSQAQNPGAAPAAEEDIRGPREALVIPVPDKLSVTQKVLITTPIAATAGLLIWFLIFRRGNAVFEMPPLEQAREALRVIDRERETLPAGDLAQQTANVVRQFVAGNFGIAAPQRTTEEFLKSLTTDRNSPLQSQLDMLQEFLTTCDKAKFAGTDFDPVERFALLETAGRFIQSAARAAVPEPSPGPSA